MNRDPSGSSGTILTLMSLTEITRFSSVVVVDGQSRCSECCLLLRQLKAAQDDGSVFSLLSFASAS